MTLRSLMLKVPKRAYAAVAIATAVIAVPAGLLAWGPGRATFTIANPADYVTFNSITDNPNIGDERNFVAIRESGTNGLWQDTQNVQPGKEYVVRLYVHNNAASNLNLVAQNVKASINLPTNTAKSIDVQGFIRSSSAQPNEVYDHATFAASQNFNLAYKAGSLKYYNNANGNGFSIPETAFTNSGASLGYDKMDGKIPGCFQYAGYLTFIVKPQFAATPDFTVSKQVSKHGENKWVENYTAQPGETVDYLVEYKNTSTIQQDDVTFRDTLPADVSYVPGSTTFRGSNGPASDNITKGGINVGSYAAGANSWAVFSAKVASKDELECGTNTLVNKVNVTTKQGGSKDDTATVVVNKTCEVKKVKACNLDTLAIEQVEESKIDDIHYTLDLDKCCPPEEKTIEVCRLEDKVYPVTIKESEFDSSKYSKNPADCKDEEEKDIEVCRLSDKTYPVTIKESEFDSTKYSKNPADCKEDEVKDITVCRLSDKKYPVTIKETEFDSAKYSKDAKDCETTETPKCEVPSKENLPVDSKDCVEDETPTELPHTGIADSFLSVLGIGSIVGVSSAYLASRRK